MADFDRAGTSERLRRVAILRDMQAKLSRSAAEALGVTPGASAAAIRSAFMELTKQYHPAKFARLDEDTVRLANEVFLQLRAAHDSLRAAATPRARTSPGRAATADAAPDMPRIPAAIAASAVPSTERAAERAAERTADSGSDGPSTSPARIRLGSEMGTTSAMGSTIGSAPRIRFSTTSSNGTPVHNPTQVLELIDKKQWRDAKLALQAVLQRDPKDRRHLAWLAYVRGCEAIDLGNVAEARRELVRALAIEPSFDMAKAALADLRSPPLTPPAPRR